MPTGYIIEDAEKESLRVKAHRRFLRTRLNARAVEAYGYPQTRTTKEILEAVEPPTFKSKHWL